MTTIIEDYMRFFAFRIKKIVDSSMTVEVAFASCWINSDAREDAYLRAEKMIVGQGWHIDETLEDHALTELSYSSGDAGLQYYEQALLDDEVLVLYVLDPAGNTEDIDHT